MFLLLLRILVWNIQRRSAQAAELVMKNLVWYVIATRNTAGSRRLQCLNVTWLATLLNVSGKDQHYLFNEYYFIYVTFMLCDDSEDSLWFVFPFSRITDQNLKPYLRIKYNFDDEVANENEQHNWFILANYVIILNTIEWSNCAVDLNLFKVIWYWSAFSCNATTIKLIRCNATQIWFSRHIISMRNHHIKRKQSRLAKAHLSCSVAFSPFWCICIEFYF